MKKTYITKYNINILIDMLYAGGGTALSMLTGAIGGIALARCLSVEDYACYSMAFAFYGTIHLLADGGTTSGAQNIARTNWRCIKHVSGAMASARLVRRKLSLFYLPLGAIVSGYLFLQHGANLPNAITLAILVVIVSHTTNESSLRSVPMYLEQRISQLQSIQLISDVVRLISLITVIFWLRNEIAAFIILLLGFFLKNWLVGRNLNPTYLTTEHATAEMVKEIKAFACRIRPIWFYASFSGSISIYLVSFFGSTNNVAAVGGLTKITLPLSVGAFIFGAIVAPRYFRENDAAAIAKKFLLSLAALAIINLFFLMPFILFPQLGLLLIGESFKGLENELRITCIGAALNAIYAGVYNLSISRGNLLRPWTYLSSVLLWNVILFFTFDVSTIQGVLWLGALTPIPGLIAYLAAAVNGIAAERKSAGLPAWSNWTS